MSVANQEFITAVGVHQELYDIVVLDSWRDGVPGVVEYVGLNSPNPVLSPAVLDSYNVLSGPLDSLDPASKYTLTGTATANQSNLLFYWASYDSGTNTFSQISQKVLSGETTFVTTQGSSAHSFAFVCETPDGKPFVTPAAITASQINITQVSNIEVV